MPSTLRLATALATLLTLQASVLAQSSDWPQRPFKQTVTVVPVDDPWHPASCTVTAIDDRTLSCTSTDSGARIVYPRENVAAILDYHQRFWTRGTVILLAATAGCIAAIVVNPLLILAIGLIALPILAVTSGPPPFAPYPRPPRPGRRRVRILYQRPGTEIPQAP